MSAQILDILLPSYCAVTVYPYLPPRRNWTLNFHGSVPLNANFSGELDPRWRRDGNVPRGGRGGPQRGRAAYGTRKRLEELPIKQPTRILIHRYVHVYATPLACLLFRSPLSQLLVEKCNAPLHNSVFRFGGFCLKASWESTIVSEGV